MLVSATFGHSDGFRLPRPVNVADVPPHFLGRRGNGVASFGQSA
jgi:hypothetical protein